MTEEAMDTYARWLAGVEAPEPSDHLIPEDRVWDPAECRHETLDTDPVLHCEDCGVQLKGTDR